MRPSALEKDIVPILLHNEYHIGFHFLTLTVNIKKIILKHDMAFVNWIKKFPP